ncbi:hypothetical protein IAQ61_003308 [Plenodomus lingam]|uniref:uncharacterized protein n=1 Tax=Leptosphaeria maculans TaxID=5022 RepID=UPI00332D513B|nr:hypothetical protein IAQ61_003308 [Plenodomus lingam]
MPEFLSSWLLTRLRSGYSLSSAYPRDLDILFMAFMVSLSNIGLITKLGLTGSKSSFGECYRLVNALREHVGEKDIDFQAAIIKPLSK